MGQTGSGKSNLLHVLITALSLSYSPEEIELYLIDFKIGIEFKIYATHQLPHARVIAIESEREFGLSVLKGLDDEFNRRGDVFKGSGLTDFRQKTDQVMPRILLVVDEFQEFFTKDDVIAQEASLILDRLVREGRAVGIHILLGSQTLAGAYSLARSSIGQMAVRIALQCSDADYRLIFNDMKSATSLPSRTGEAIYNSATGLAEANNLFQVALLPYEQRVEHLNRIKKFSKERSPYPTRSQFVFEGNAPADPESAQALNDLLANPKWKETRSEFSFGLGEPIAVKKATSAHIKRQAGSNLAIIGQNNEAAMGMMTIGLLTLAAQHSIDSAQFFILDFISGGTKDNIYLKTLADIIPHTYHYGKRNQILDYITIIANELEHRFEDQEDILQDKPTIYLVMYGLQRARKLKPEDSFEINMSLESTSESQKQKDINKSLKKVITDGPDFGVHTILWCDTYVNLVRRLNRNALRDFGMRVAFQMGRDDSLILMETQDANKLGAYRALFYNEEENYLEKFRPYKTPKEDWLKKIAQRFSESK
jgi:hypothetical protein